MASHKVSSTPSVPNIVIGTDAAGNYYYLDIDDDGKLSSKSSLQGYNGTNYQPVRIDTSTRSLQIIDYAHHEIHAGSSYHAFVYDNTAATGELVNIYIKTASTTKYCHMFAQWSSGGAAIFRIYEAPTITANTGTNGLAVINHNRNSSSASGCFDNATEPVVNKYGTGVTKTVDGTVLLVEYSGVGKTVTGSGRNESEYILLPNTVYLFEVIAIGNNIALNIGLDWYEHTDQAT